MIRFRADQWGTQFRDPLWQYISRVVYAHPSQFDSRLAIVLDGTPPTEKVVGLLPLENFLADPRYEFCN